MGSQRTRSHLTRRHAVTFALVSALTCGVVLVGPIGSAGAASESESMVWTGTAFAPPSPSTPDSTSPPATVANTGTLSEDELDRRLAAQDAEAHRLALLNDYTSWEAQKAAEASTELEHRIELSQMSAQSLALAREAARAARERAAQATGSAAGQAGADAQAASTAESAAAAQAERDQLLSQRAREQAAAEASNTSAGEQAAVEVRSDARNQAQSGGQAPASAQYAWSTYVANIDSQAAIDSCAGGVTYSPDVSDILGKAYYPIHNYCNGEPILKLQNGDLVHIEDVGDFRVVGSQDVNKGDTTEAIKDLPGQALLQTCYPNSNKMRVVALDPVA